MLHSIEGDSCGKSQWTRSKRKTHWRPPQCFEEKMVRKTFWNNTIIRCFGDCNCVFNSYFRIELICIRQTVIMLTIIPAIILIGAALKYRVNKIHNNINIHIYAKISSISIYITCVTNQSTGRFPPVILAISWPLAMLAVSLSPAVEHRLFSPFLASLALRLSRVFEPTPPLAAALCLVFGTSICNKLQLPRPKTAAQQPAFYQL